MLQKTITQKDDTSAAQYKLTKKDRYVTDQLYI